MGLDMYLYKKHYVKNWEHMKPEERHSFLIKKGGKKVDDIKPERISEITEEVACWRKANAIHNWFVENVQEGEDNCKEYYVSREDLKTLRDLCDEVLEKSKVVKGKVVNGQTATKDGWVDNLEDGELIENPEIAEELLPTTSGFFFGGTNYDKWYLQDIKYTKETLDELLKEEDGGDYYYSSSW